METRDIPDVLEGNNIESSETSASPSNLAPESTTANEPETSAANPTSERTANKTNKRGKHKCPYPNCNSAVVHLRRHMVLSHGWSKKDAKNVLSNFELRKQRKIKNTTTRKFTRMACAYPRCTSVVKRIHNHLHDVHKFKPGSAEFKKFLCLSMSHDLPHLSEESMSIDSSSSSEPEKLWLKDRKSAAEKSSKSKKKREIKK